MENEFANHEEREADVLLSGLLLGDSSWPDDDGFLQQPIPFKFTCWWYGSEL